MSTRARRSQRAMSPLWSPVCTQLTPPSRCAHARDANVLAFSLSPDDTFADLADGKLDGQKAFMTGKLKTKGNMMLATKLGPVLATAKPKAKL